MDKQWLLREVSKANKYPLPILERNMNRTYDEIRKDSKMRFFFDRFQPKPGETVLDVGCFIGSYDAVLARRFPKTTFIGYDIDKLYIRAAQNIYTEPNLTFHCKDIFDAKIAPGSVDHIFFFEVLEHVDNPRQFLELFHRLLRKGGKLYLSTPSALGITNVLWNMMHQDLKYIENEPQNTGTEKDHLYVWDKLTLYRLLFRSGFRKPTFSVSRKFLVRQGQSLCFIVEK